MINFVTSRHIRLGVDNCSSLSDCISLTTVQYVGYDSSCPLFEHDVSMNQAEDCSHLNVHFYYFINNKFNRSKNQKHHS